MNGERSESEMLVIRYLKNVELSMRQSRSRTSRTALWQKDRRQLEVRRYHIVVLIPLPLRHSVLVRALQTCDGILNPPWGHRSN